MQEVRQENYNGPFWPHTLWIYESKDGQELQERSQNCYQGETPIEPETDCYFYVEWDHPRNIHLFLLTLCTHGHILLFQPND